MAIRRVMVRLAVGVSMILLGTVVWVEGATLASMSYACADEEEKDYPRLEAVAQEVLGDVADQSHRYSSCEDTGEPGASVRVSVYDWDSRREARRWLRDSGLTFVPGAGILTLDGLQVGYVGVVDLSENHGRMFVQVSFFNAP